VKFPGIFISVINVRIFTLQYDTIEIQVIINTYKQIGEKKRPTYKLTLNLGTLEYTIREQSLNGLFRMRSGVRVWKVCTQ
jgi:hypothetical protein